MSTPSRAHSQMGRIVREFRSSWQSLVLTAIASKVLALIVLTPLMGVLVRGLFALSGRRVMSDLDLLYYFLGPAGWICGITAGAIGLAILALEQAALLDVLAARSAGRHLGPLAALRCASAHVVPVIRVTMRMVSLTLLALVPFLAIVAAAYFVLLTRYDINYYLQEKPPQFGVAIGIGVIAWAASVALLLRLFSGWYFALPLVVLESVHPQAAIRASAARAVGHRRTIVSWLVGWALVMTALSALATGAVGWIGRWLTPASSDSLRILVVIIGSTLLLATMANLAVNLLSTTTFAATLFCLYQAHGREKNAGPLPSPAVVELPQTGFRITRLRMVAVATVAVIAALATGAVALQDVVVEDHVEIMAHRGASQATPENTLAAFRQAVRDGADWIELDVQETADGEIVVFHDSDFMKLAGQNLKIWNATLDNLKRIDIGSWFAPEFQGERVPTLAEVLRECRGKIRVMIELKYYGHDEQLEPRVAEIVDAHEMASEVMAMSLQMEGVRKMKAIRPDWQVGLLMSVSAGDLDKMEADFLAVNASFVSRKLIRTAHRSGKDVYVWTVNDALTMSRMISHGVDGLLTDAPALTRSVLRQRAGMSVPERLLLEFAGMLGTKPNIVAQ